MSEQLQSILIGTAGLTLAATIAVLLTYIRNIASITYHQRISRLILVGVVLHLIHFSEETCTGFYHQFPTLLGLAPWPISFFIWFNLLCMAFWLSCIGLMKRSRWAIAPIWFLAIASITNLVAHPLLSLAIGGYFPGLWSSPLIGILGIVLFRVLLSATKKYEVLDEQ